MLKDLDDKGTFRGFSSTQDLISMSIRFPASNVLVYGGYCRDGDTAGHLARIASDTQGEKLGFVWVSDFNTPIDIIIENPAFQELNAMVIKPSGASVSCVQGKGSVIDYVIASRTVAPCLSTRCETDAPWGTHLGIRISIKRDPLAITRKVLTQPAWKLKPITDDMKGVQGMSWEEAVRQAKDEECDDEPGTVGQRQVAQQLGMATEARNLGIAYRRWAAAFEIQELSRRGLDPKNADNFGYKGRATTPRFKDVPLRLTDDLSDEASAPGGAGLIAMLWPTLRTHAARVKNAITAKNRKRAVEHQKDLANMPASDGRAHAKAWHAADTADKHAARAASPCTLR